MIVCVVGAGRSGTNMALEILSGYPMFNPSEPEEDKKFFQSDKYPFNYLTKCDTCYFKGSQLAGRMDRNKDMKLIWTIRHPYDMAMSKLRRGVSFEEGGDCPSLADDATPEGCLIDIYAMKEKHEIATYIHKDRILTVKMEDMLFGTEREARNMCEFLDIEYNDKMPEFWTRMRNKKKKERYKGKDLSQLYLYKHWRTAYDGWFTKAKMDLKPLFGKLQFIAAYFGYETNFN